MSMSAKCARHKIDCQKVFFFFKFHLVCTVLWWQFRNFFPSSGIAGVGQKEEEVKRPHKFAVGKLMKIFSVCSSPLPPSLSLFSLSLPRHGTSSFVFANLIILFISGKMTFFEKWPPSRYENVLGCRFLMRRERERERQKMNIIVQLLLINGAHVASEGRKFASVYIRNYSDVDGDDGKYCGANDKNIRATTYLSGTAGAMWLIIMQPYAYTSAVDFFLCWIIHIVECFW